MMWTIPRLPLAGGKQLRWTQRSQPSRKSGGRPWDLRGCEQGTVRHWFDQRSAHGLTPCSQRSPGSDARSARFDPSSQRSLFPDAQYAGRWWRKYGKKERSRYWRNCPRFTGAAPTRNATPRHTQARGGRHRGALLRAQPRATTRQHQQAHHRLLRSLPVR
jgi:hypothetical protein